MIDLSGYDHCEIFVTIGATDIALTALKVQESDTKSSATALSSGADVTGLVYGTSTNLAGSTSSLPSNTDGNKVFSFDIDCKARKRYVLPVLTVGAGSTGAYTSILAVLSKPEQAPTTASGRGCGDVLQV